MKYWIVIPFLFINSIYAIAQNRAPEVTLKHPEKLKAGELYSFTIQLARNGNTGGCLLNFEFPFGYLVNEQQSDNALFSFSDSKLEYHWIILPEKDTLIIEFALLIPENATGQANINGNISYTLNEVRIESSISPMQFFVETESKQTLEKKSSSASHVNTDVAQSLSKEQKSTEPHASNYKIQIGAFKNQVSLSSIAAQYAIPVTEIVEFKHQGLFKYAFGAYSNPSEARNAIKKYPQLIDKAFVIAFRDGKRVNLDETMEGLKEDNE